MRVFRPMKKLLNWFTISKSTSFKNKSGLILPSLEVCHENLEEKQTNLKNMIIGKLSF